MRTGFLTICALLIGTSVLAADADERLCSSKDAKAQIAACTRMIKSGQYNGKGLASAHHNRALAYEDQRNYDAALADYTKALSLDPQRWTSHLNRGMVLGRKGKLREALADFDKAAAMNPRNARIAYGRADAYKELGDLQNSIKYFGVAVELEPKADGFRRRAEVFALRAEWEAAANDITSALALEPDEYWYYLFRADYHAKTSKEKALASLKQGMAIAQGTDSDVFKARIADLEGNTSEARNMYERILTENLDDALHEKVKNYLARLEK